MIRGVHHVAISTPDIDRLAAFYVDVVGFEPVMSTSWSDRPIIDRIIDLPGSAARQLMLQAGNAYLELFQYESPVGAPADPGRTPANHGYTHFCLDVTDIDAEYERLSANGMTFHAPPPTSDELGNGSTPSDLRPRSRRQHRRAPGDPRPDRAVRPRTHPDDPDHPSLDDQEHAP